MSSGAPASLSPLPHPPEWSPCRPRQPMAGATVWEDGPIKSVASSQQSLSHHSSAPAPASQGRVRGKRLGEQERRRPYFTGSLGIISGSTGSAATRSLVSRAKEEDLVKRNELVNKREQRSKDECWKMMKLCSRALTKSQSGGPAPDLPCLPFYLKTPLE